MIKKLPTNKSPGADSSTGKFYETFRQELTLTLLKLFQIGKEEVKLSLFADDMIPYIENPKDATRKLLELSNEFRLISKKTSQDQESHAKDLL